MSSSRDRRTQGAHKNGKAANEHNKQKKAECRQRGMLAWFRDKIIKRDCFRFITLALTKEEKRAANVRG
jgi:hypothetical protein